MEELCGLYGLYNKVCVMDKVEFLKRQSMVSELLSTIEGAGIMLNSQIKRVVSETVMEFGVVVGKFLVCNWYMACREAGVVIPMKTVFEKLSRENPALVVSNEEFPRVGETYRFDEWESSKWS
jgi:hypothetical protein